MSIRTLLIGLDGATFDVLDPLMRSGDMPFLRSFFETGVRAELRTIVPALTPPAWTSLMTGRRPGDHGVFDFFRRETPDGLHIRFFSSSDVNTETIWSIAAANSMRVTSLNFPAMFPAPKLPGYIVPGWVPWRQLRLACWPSDLFESLKSSVPGFNPRELAMDIGLEEKATEGCSNEAELGPWIDLHTRREENWFEIYRVLTEQQPSELTAIVFDGVDKLQHLCWRFIKPDPTEPLTELWELQIREQCLNYFRKLDTVMARMCSIAGPDTTVLLASDHGFQSSRDVFHVNAWLAKHGYLTWADQVPASQSNGILGVGQVARHTWQLDWTRTKAFAATPTSNGIYIVVNRDGNSPGIAPEEYESLRDRILEQLEEVVNPETGKRIVTAAHKREDIFGATYRDYAPDLTLELHDGGLVSILRGEEILSQRPVTSGFHAPVGIFGAKGPGIRQGHTAEQMSILDVAPVILHALGLPADVAMEGIVRSDLWETGHLDGVPATRVKYATAGNDKPAGPEEGLNEEDEAIVLERLRHLGYIE